MNGKGAALSVTASLSALVKEDRTSNSMKGTSCLLKPHSSLSKPKSVNFTHAKRTERENQCFENYLRNIKHVLHHSPTQWMSWLSLSQRGLAWSFS
jgi:hypothetical protein